MNKKSGSTSNSSYTFINTMMFSSILFIISWFIIFSVNAFDLYPNYYTNMFTSALREVINLFIFILLVRLYLSTSDHTNKKIYFWFIFAMVGRLIYRLVIHLELYYYHISFSSFFHAPISSLHFFAYSIFYIPLLWWYIGLITFLTILLVNNIQDKTVIIKNFAIVMVSVAPVSILFFFSFKHEMAVFNTVTILQIFIIIYKFILFVIFIVCVLYANNSFLRLLLIGIGIETASGTLSHYSALSNSQELILWGETFSYLGFIFIFIALILFAKSDVLLQKSFKNVDSIKSKISLWTFNFSIGGIIIFSILEYLLGFLNKNFFGGLPFYIIIYSIVIVVISIFIGDYFGYRFKRFATSLNLIMSGKNKDKISSNFKIEEFALLHKYMLNLSNIKEEKDKLEKEFGNISAKAAHDLGSPLASINAEIHNIKNNEVNSINYRVLESSLNRIKEITSNILIQYRGLSNNNSKLIDKSNNIIDRSNEPRYINIVNLINDLIDAKKLEWQSHNCNIKLASALDYPMFLFCPSQLRRTLSNLLNNAYESFHNEHGEILVYLKETQTELVIIIKDNGCGIPSDKIKDILSGKSLKHKGKGLGVSSAIEYVKSLGGTLNLLSEINSGTELTIELPFPILPSWLVKDIPYSQNSTFVILDDDPSIHVKMQMHSRRINTKSIHFTEVKSFFNFINETQTFNNFILLIDLNLNDPSWNGIKIISSLPNNIDKANIYLITNDAEDINVQDNVRMYKIQLIPKRILDCIL
ncbi:MAG: sensor histidine kinase [Neisseriaceae bacterium]